MEYWDAYDASGHLTGDTLIRGEPIPDGLYHLVCEVLVRHTDGDYLLMKRSALKPNFPGCYEATSCGSALQGEDAHSCIRRELYEETGIVCDDFTEVWQYCDQKHTLYHGYVCTVNIDKTAIRLQDGETEGYLWLNETDFLAFARSSKAIPPQMLRWKNYLRL